MALGYLATFLSPWLLGKRKGSGRWSVPAVAAFAAVLMLGQASARTSPADMSRPSAVLADPGPRSPHPSLSDRPNGRTGPRSPHPSLPDRPNGRTGPRDDRPNDSQGTVGQGPAMHEDHGGLLQQQTIQASRSRLEDLAQATAYSISSQQDPNSSLQLQPTGTKEDPNSSLQLQPTGTKEDPNSSLQLQPTETKEDAGEVLGPARAGKRSLLSVTSKEKVSARRATSSAAKDYDNSSIFFQPERRKSGRSKVKYPARLSRQEDELRARAKKEPEHKLYSEDLLLRRLKDIHAEGKLRKGERPQDATPEDDDSWQSELAIRRQLAERAVDYGIQQRRERLRNPDPDRELTVGQRIKKDAEEILRRRKEENGGVSLPRRDGFIRIEIPVVEIEQLMPPARGEKPALGGTVAERLEEDEDEDEDKDEDEAGGHGNRTRVRKTPKAIRKLLNSATGRMGGRSSPKSREVLHDNHHDNHDADDDKDDEVDRQVLANIDENFVKLEEMLHVGGLSRRRRKRLKRETKARIQRMTRQKRDAYYRSIGLPLLKVPDNYTPA